MYLFARIFVGVLVGWGGGHRIGHSEDQQFFPGAANQALPA